jgi:curli biogenesis system outer membrane secretion channel CsgG
MKRLSICTMLLFLGAAVLKAEVPRVAVLDLVNKSDYKNAAVELESGLADILTAELVNTQRFKVISREDVKKILTDQGLSQTGIETPQAAAEMGKTLGVDYVVIGEVSQYGLESAEAGATGAYKNHSASVGLDIKFIDIISAEVFSAATSAYLKTVRMVKLSEEDILPPSEKVGSDHYKSSLIGKAAAGAIEDVDAMLRYSSISGGDVQILHLLLGVSFKTDFSPFEQ